MPACGTPPPHRPSPCRKSPPLLPPRRMLRGQAAAGAALLASSRRRGDRLSSAQQALREGPAQARSGRAPPAEERARRSGWPARLAGSQGRAATSLSASPAQLLARGELQVVVLQGRATGQRSIALAPPAADSGCSHLRLEGRQSEARSSASRDPVASSTPWRSVPMSRTPAPIQNKTRAQTPPTIQAAPVEADAAKGAVPSAGRCRHLFRQQSFRTYSKDSRSV